LIAAGSALLFALQRFLPDRFALGFLTGSVNGLANLLFLSMIIKATLNPQGVKKLHAIIGAIGINATIAVFIVAPLKQMVDAVGMIAGFTVALVVLVAGFYVSIKKKGT
jgi:phage-related holin